MNSPITGTLLFQGDSITDAFRRPEEINDSYRLGNGYAFIVASMLRATTGQAALSVQNRGISGEGAPQLLARWQRDCLELRPDTLSLLVGINDAGGGPPAVPLYVSAFDALLAQVAATVPRCRVVLLEPFALKVGAAEVHRLAQLPAIQAHVRAAAVRTGATFVPLQQAFDAVAGDRPERWIYDGIHPTAAGQWLIAQRWLEVVAGITLPAPVAMA